MRSDDVGGVHIKYLHHCRRQLWLYARGFRPESGSDRVKLGEEVHDTTFPRHHSIDLGSFRQDHVDTDGWIHETKSSRRPMPADQAQATHYAHRLHQLGVPVEGTVLHYPATRRTITVNYDSEAESQARQGIADVLDVISSPTAPERLEPAACHGCSYFDYCWSE